MANWKFHRAPIACRLTGRRLLRANINFKILDLDSTEAIEFDTQVSGDLVLGSQTNSYSFEAQAGDQIQIEFPESSNPASIFYRLLGPDGTAIFRGGSLANSEPIDLQFSGNYKLLVEGSVGNLETENYTVNVAFLGNTPRDPFEGQTLTLGQTANETIANEGSPDLFTFELAERTAVYFDALTDNANLQWSLEGPRGTLVDSRSFNASDSFNGFSLLSLVAGEYQLRIADIASEASDYAFQLRELTGDSDVTLGLPISAEQTIPNQTDVFRFDAVAGQQFFVDFVESSDLRNTLYRVVDPLGQIVAQVNSLNDSGVFTAELGGTYSLLVEGWISNTGLDTYTVNIVDATSIETAFNIGDIVEGTIDAPGRSFVYDFEVNSAGSYYLDALNAGPQVEFLLESQSNTAAFVPLAFGDSIDRLSVYNLAAGSYKITIDQAGDAVGDFEFRFANLNDATRIELGDLVEGQLTVPNETDAYQFDALAGESVFFDVVSTDNG